jgi:hypothetical protein
MGSPATVRGRCFSGTNARTSRFSISECAHLQILYIRQLAQHLTPRDFLARSAAAADDDACKGGRDVCALQKIVDLLNSYLDDVRVAHRKIAVRLGLLQLELRHEIGAGEFLLPP